jgi:prepilin-type N-terminal cleavage/methylation domain-containing protein
MAGKKQLKISGKFKERNCKEGFTLVEVLMAALILSVTLASSLLVFTKTNILVSRVQQRNIATQAAKEEIERIRDMSFDDAIALDSSFTTTSFSELFNPVGALTIDDPFDNDDIRRVTVTVTWNTAQGKELSTTLGTLITRGGINRE